MSPLLIVDNLSKAFLNDNRKISVLENIDLTVNHGEFLSIVGPSGCGKSTLLTIIAGFSPYDSGRITLNNKDISKPEANRVMVFQDFNQLFPWKTILENVMFPLKINKIGSSHRERIEIGKRYLSMVKLQDYFNYYPHQLSGGMKQRATIARALAIDPEILLMDEPFVSLDIQTRTELQKLLIEIWQETKKTIIFVTHDIGEAILLSDRILYMDKGPNNIKKIIRNHLDRPRNTFDDSFNQLYKEIHQIFKY